MFIDAAAQRCRDSGDPSDKQSIKFDRGRFSGVLPWGGGFFGGELKMTFEHLLGKCLQIALEPEDQGVLMCRLATGGNHGQRQVALLGFFHTKVFWGQALSKLLNFPWCDSVAVAKPNCMAIAAMPVLV